MEGSSYPPLPLLLATSVCHYHVRMHGTVATRGLWEPNVAAYSSIPVLSSEYKMMYATLLLLLRTLVLTAKQLCNRLWMKINITVREAEALYQIWRLKIMPKISFAVHMSSHTPRLPYHPPHRLPTNCRAVCCIWLKDAGKLAMQN